MADAVSDVFEYGIAFLLVFIMLIVFAMMIGSFKNAEVDTSEIDPYIYLAKVHYSPYILYETDLQTNQPITGLVSREKLSKLDANNRYENPYIAANFTLLNKAGAPVDKDSSYYNNKKLFLLLEPFARNNILGKGGASFKSFTIPVSYKQGTRIERGFLLIELVRLNS